MGFEQGASNAVNHGRRFAFALGAVRRDHDDVARQSRGPRMRRAPVLQLNRGELLSNGQVVLQSYRVSEHINANMPAPR